jgi:hypothetical protein
MKLFYRLFSSSIDKGFRSAKTMIPSLRTALRALSGKQTVPEAVQWLVARTIETTTTSKVPVDPFAIAQALGVPVSFRQLPVHGLLVDEHVETAKCGVASDMGIRNRENLHEEWGLSSRSAIHLCSDVESDSSRRCHRFTLAHELGHYVLRREIRASYETYPFERFVKSEEDLCNAFAADLLMPGDQVKHYFKMLCDHTDFTVATWVDVANNCFDISLRDFAYRTHDVTNGAIQLILWSFETGDAVPEWASWAINERLRVADPKCAGVYRAFVCETRRSVERFDAFHLDGRRFDCFSSSLVLSDTRKVLSLLVPEPYRLESIGIPFNYFGNLLKKAAAAKRCRDAQRDDSLLRPRDCAMLESLRMANGRDDFAPAGC